MKNQLLRFVRSKRLQPLWEKLYHYSKIGMNLWGGASLKDSGETYALQYAKSKVSNKSLVTVFDVGANYGQYALLACKILKEKAKVLAFEPSRPVFDSLNEIILTTKLLDKVKTYNIGLGEIKSKLVLHSSGIGDSRASLYNLQTPMAGFNSRFDEDVSIHTIDEFCEENKIDEIDYLKLDIEGHEFYALKGAKEMIAKRKIKYIQFEFGECNIDSRTFFRDFYDYLSPQYKFFRIVSDGLRPIVQYSNDLETFCISNFLAELQD